MTGRATLAALLLEPATVARVNRALRLLGRGERLRRGRGYYYFVDGETARWYQVGVYCYRMAGTVRAWVDERDRLASDVCGF